MGVSQSKKPFGGSEGVLLAVVLALAMTFSLSACGKDNDKKEEQSLSVQSKQEKAGEQNAVKEEAPVSSSITRSSESVKATSASTAQTEREVKEQAPAQAEAPSVNLETEPQENALTPQEATQEYETEQGEPTEELQQGGQPEQGGNQEGCLGGALFN